MDTIAKETSGRSTTTYPDILSVIQNFCEFLPFVLKLGYSVRMGDFGTIRIAVSAPKILFRASSKLKSEIAKLNYETIK